MNIKKLLMLAPVAVLSLTSCGASKRYPNSKYQIDLKWDKTKNFNILHLTDFHISNASDNPKHFAFIKETVEAAQRALPQDEKIDLIAITGDMFIFAGRSEANELFNFLDSLKINWAPTFGNHDEQVYFPVDWLTSRLNELNKKRTEDGESYCVFTDLQDDDVFGNANYVINLKKDNGTIAEQLYFFDSNRYNFGEYRGYDYIHYDQIDWYERQLAEFNDKSPLERPKSLAFFHIPFPEFEEYYQNASKGDSLQYKFADEYTDHDSSSGDPKVNTGLYQKMIDHGMTNGVFVGHNHTSNYIVEYRESGVSTEFPTMTLGFGVKGTNKVYCDPDKLGGQIISLDKANSGQFSIKRILHKYGE